MSYSADFIPDASTKVFVNYLKKHGWVQGQSKTVDDIVLNPNSYVIKKLNLEKGTMPYENNNKKIVDNQGFTLVTKRQKNNKKITKLYHMSRSIDNELWEDVSYETRMKYPELETPKYAAIIYIRMFNDIIKEYSQLIYHDQKYFLEHK